jgi:hypothetical protein
VVPRLSVRDSILLYPVCTPRARKNFREFETLAKLPGSRSHALRGKGLPWPLCGEERRLHAVGATDPTRSVAAMRSPRRAWEREAAPSFTCSRSHPNRGGSRPADVQHSWRPRARTPPRQLWSSNPVAIFALLVRVRLGEFLVSSRTALPAATALSGRAQRQVAS